MEDIEQRVAQRCQGGEYDDATTLAIQAYGPEVLGYLASTVSAWHQAADIFAMCSEDLWRALPTFERRCSYRTYFYTLARNARSRFFKARSVRDAARAVPLSQVPQIRLAIDHVRTSTPRYRRTEEKERLVRLRESLDSRDRELLILRVDRQLSWPDIIAIMDSDDGSKSDAERTREAAALRKRFERIKKRLKKLHAAEVG